MDELPLSACWTLPDHVDRAAQRWPDTEALVFGDERLTFAGFAEHTRAIARGLLALGVTPGQKVGVFMLGVPDMLAAIYGAGRIGAVAVPINGRFKARELRYVVSHADVDVLVASAAYVDLVQEALGDRDARAPRHIVIHGGEPGSGFGWTEMLEAGRSVDQREVAELQQRIAVRDTAMLMYTSGTTANPKGCLISHESLVRTGRIFGLERFPMRHGDRVWDPLPLFHLASILPFNGCLETGATYIGMQHFDAGEALTVLESERCTCAFPAFDLIWIAIQDHPRFATTDLSRIRLVNVNGVPEKLAMMAAKTPWLTQISPYGATEGGGVMALSHLDDALEYRVGSAGRPFAGMEVRIADPDTGAELPPGERGEITYRGPVLFDGYYKQPEATAAAFDADGFFHSGDLGSVDADGRLTFIGRLKDMLKVGGENVAAAEIEGFLAEHPAVAEVQVVAAPDERYIEVPCAYVVLRPGATLEYDELLAYCHGRIATYKIPRYLRLVTEWPMSGTKIQKFRLRDQIACELKAAGIRSAPKIAAPAATR
ncbi:MAG TPA: AMP-binding protein [Solirubrobacteraceae bacterium]|nr:AMP-binding protein [Solirubrobacteraceae bacterium]